MPFRCRHTCLKNIFSHFLSRRTVSALRLSRKHARTMDAAYFRYTDGDDKFHFTFLYGEPPLAAPRQFNFVRRSGETVGTFLGRVNVNLDKFLGKKNKSGKRKTKKAGEGGGGESNVEKCDEEVPLAIELVREGKPLSADAVCVDVMRADAELRIVDKAYRIVVNAPWVTEMSLPTSILAEFPVYPLKFEGLFLEKERSSFEWHAAHCNAIAANVKWEKVGEGFTFYPTTYNIGMKLKFTCLPGNSTMMGPVMEVISTCNVEAGPGVCPFENRHQFTKNKLDNDRIRVMSYNLLADLYCDSDYSRTELFPYCPPYALKIDYRKQLFLKEILGFNGDIICLQEVDAKIFDNDLSSVLGAKSYNGIFTRKGGQVAEGVACFYRNDRFKLIDEKSCILGNELKSPIFQEIWSLIENNEPFVNRLQPRTTAVQATVLESIENPQEIIVVGNTHFYFQPDSDHIRVMQGGLTILWLKSIVEDLKVKHPDRRVSLILCGDFNSVPSCGVYQLYTTGYVPSDCIDWRSNEAEAVTNVSLRQPFKLASACGTPQYTNYTEAFADCLDYIFYQTDSFDVVQVVPLPSVEELSQHTAIPSVVFPSDHVSLVADLQFRKS